MKKKLLAILSILTICCSSMAFAVGCNNTPDNSTDNSENSSNSSVVEDEVSISLNKTALTLEIPEEEMLVATVENSEEDVVWTSSNPEIATVSETGKVTAIAVGTATITATVEEKTATCTVTVTTPPISLHFYDEELGLKVTDEYTVVLTCTNGDGMTVAWSVDESENLEIVSSKTTIANNQCEATIKANKTGNSTVSVVVNGVTATLPVSITDKYALTINGVEEVEKYLGLSKTYTLNYTYEKNGVAGDASDIEWTVSDSAIASLSNGVLTTTAKSGSFTVKGVVGDVEQEMTFGTYIPVASATDFANIANDLTANYVLTKSIDFATSGKPTRVSPIAPYANTGASKDTGYYPQENEFEGIFDGNGYALMNYTPYAGNNTQNALFGALGEKGIIRNVSLINASMYLGGSSLVYWCEGRVENIYLEMNIGGPTTALTKNNPLAGVITKMQLQSSIENCVVHMNLASGKEYNTTQGQAIEKYGTVVGYMSNQATMKNCYAFNSFGLNLVSLPTNKDNIIDSEVYANDEIYKADYSKFDKSLWNVTTDNVATLKNTNFTPTLSCATTLSVQAGGSATLAITAKGNYIVSLKTATDGVTITENANIVVDASVQSGTTFTIVVRSFANSTVYKEIVCTVA